MKIVNWYCGGTDRLTGYMFDTESKTYKQFCLKGETWAVSWKQGNNFYSGPKDGFKDPGDLAYYFPTLWECMRKLEELKKLGFTEDNDIVLDFGILTC